MRHPRSGPRPGRLRQRGQALIWLMGTMATAMAILYGVYNVAQITTGKEKAINAADAAALAGATVEARMLNLMAYNNRSMMANEAFLVQLSSLESWLGYVGETGRNIGAAVALIPFLEAFAAAMEEVGTVAEGAQGAVRGAIDVVIPVLEAEKIALHIAHAAIATLGGAVAEDAAAKIVAANRATFGAHVDAGVSIDDRVPVRALTLVRNQSAWINFTKYYDGNLRTDARAVLLASRDDFTTNRPGQPYLNLSLGVFGAEKHGGSTLVNFDRWEAQDTLEGWWKLPVPFASKHYIPIGWGRSNVSRNFDLGDTWSPYRPAQRLAQASGSTHAGWSGVPSVYDVRDKSSANKATLAVDYFVAVKRSQPANLTTQELKMQSAHSDSVLGSSEMNERLQANQLSALGKAHVIFDRPRAGLSNDWTAPKDLPRPDGAKEYGSLFSPYWQARLVDYSLGEKAAMYAAMGINPALAVTTPGGH